MSLVLGHTTPRSQCTAKAVLKSLECQAHHCIKGILICIAVQKLSILFSLFLSKKGKYSECYPTECFKTEFSKRKYKEILVILFIAEIKNKLYIFS